MHERVALTLDQVELQVGRHHVGASCVAAAALGGPLGGAAFGSVGGQLLFVDVELVYEVEESAVNDRVIVRVVDERGDEAQYVVGVAQWLVEHEAFGQEILQHKQQQQQQLNETTRLFLIVCFFLVSHLAFDEQIARRRTVRLEQRLQLLVLVKRGHRRLSCTMTFALTLESILNHLYIYV